MALSQAEAPVAYLYCNRSAIPDATIDLAKRALANEGAQLNILPGLLFAASAHLDTPHNN